MSFQFTAALLLDVALVLVVLGTMAYFTKRGFVAGLLDLVGNLAALLLAWLTASKLSPTVFENFFKSGLISKTAQTIQTQGGVNLSAVLDGLSTFLPQSFIDGILKSAGDVLNTAAPDTAQQIVETVVAPLVMPLIGVAMFFVTYLLCKLVLSFLVAALTNINRIPLVGGANKGLGLLLGFASGVINALLVLCFIWAVVGVTGNKLPVLNDAALSGSYLYTAFSQYNPFL